MKIPTKLIKIMLFLIIILLLIFIYPTISTYTSVLLDIFISVFIACGLAYVSYPIIKFLKKLGLPKALASLITLLLFILVISLAIYLAINLIMPQIIHVFNLLQRSNDGVEWIKSHPELNSILQYISPYIDNFGKTAINYITSITQGIITGSTKFISSTLLILCLYLYLVFDIDNIIVNIKTKLAMGSKRYRFFKDLNKQYLRYLRGLSLIILITCIEYGIVYRLINHPDWLSLAALCAFANLIPYFGGIIVNIIALTTALFYNQNLFYAVLICIIILPTIDGNLINPLVHKKTIKVNPLVLLPSIFVGSALFGFLGLILALPAIIFYKVFKQYYGKQTIQYLKKLWEN